MLATYKEVNITLQGSTVSISSFAHVDAILIQPCLSKSHGEKKIKLKKPKYLSSNKVRLPGSRTSRVPFVSTFLFLNEAPGTRTSVGEISWSFDAHTLEITHKHVHKTKRTSLQKA
jgi:hypothetical protein